MKLPSKNDDEFDVFHIFCVRNNNRDSLREWLEKNQIKTEIHYPIPPHAQNAMKGIISRNWPIAEVIHQTSLSLPISNGTTKYEVERICEVVKNFK